MPQEYRAYVTAWRRLQRWQQEGVWDQIRQEFLSRLDGEGKLYWSRAFLNGSFVPAKRGGEEVGLTKVGKGTKCMLAPDGEGIPLALVASANRAEVKLAKASLERIRAPRERGMTAEASGEVGSRPGA